ncbi:MAG: hypothetical protein WC352_06425 [Candidatus Omnitrophota bacterium]|jgi:tetratricopeptide (TPR) repeat protein
MNRSSVAKFRKPALRVALLLLAAVCLQQSWMGLELSRAEGCFVGNDFSGAVRLLSGSGRFDALRSPDAIELLGKSAWQEWIRNKDRERLVQAQRAFTQLTLAAPGYGRAWLYLALSQSAMDQGEPGGMEAVRWRRIHALLLKAYELERGSAWMQWMTASRLLASPQFLSGREKAEALERMKNAIALHHRYQPPHYLKPALTLLWKKFSDFTLLRKVTPIDAVSYNTLIEWMDGHGLWEYRQSVLRQSEAMNRAFCRQKAGEGLGLLRKGRPEEALAAFRNASWICQESSAAQAGILAAEAVMVQGTGKEEKILRQILEEEEEPEVADFFPFLERAVIKSGEPYLQGLLAYRRGDFAVARQYFEKTAPAGNYPFLRRYGAEADWKSGNPDAAISALEPALEEESPDLRELLLLAEWESPVRAKAQALVQKTMTRASDDAWWAWGAGFHEVSFTLARPGRIGRRVQLLPGEVTFRIRMRGRKGVRKDYPYLAARLSDGRKERRIGTVYADSEDWKDYGFTVRTSGGPRWLDLELMNGDAASGAQNPKIELETMEVGYGAR